MEKYDYKNFSAGLQVFYFMIIYLLFLVINLALLIFSIETRTLLIIKILLVIHHTIFIRNEIFRFHLSGILTLYGLYCGINFATSIVQFAIFDKNEYPITFIIFTIIELI